MLVTLPYNQGQLDTPPPYLSYPSPGSEGAEEEEEDTPMVASNPRARIVPKQSNV